MACWDRVKAAAGRLLAGIDRLEEEARESSPEAEARRMAREGQDGPRELTVPVEAEVELEELELDPVGEPQEIVLDELTDPSVEPSSLDSLLGAEDEPSEELTELGLPASARRVASLDQLDRADEVPLGRLELDEDELEPTVLDGDRADRLREMARASDMGLVEAETRHEDDAELARLVDSAVEASTVPQERPELSVEDTEEEEITEEEVVLPEAVAEEEPDSARPQPEVQAPAEPSAQLEEPPPMEEAQALVDDAVPVEVDTEESVEITDFALDALVWEEDEDDPDTNVEAAPAAVSPAAEGYRPRFKNSLLIADTVVAQALRTEHYPELEDLDDGTLCRLARLDHQLLQLGEALGTWALEVMDSEDPLVEAGVLYTGMRTAQGIREERAAAAEDPVARRRLGWASLALAPELAQAVPGLSLPQQERLHRVLSARDQLFAHVPGLDTQRMHLPVQPQGLHALPGFAWSD